MSTRDFWGSSAGRLFMSVALTLVLSGAVGAGAPAARAGEQDYGDVEQGAFSEYTLGVFLLEKGSPREAIPHLKSAWKLGNHDEIIGEKLADAYFRSGQLILCAEVLDDILAKNAGNERALLLRAKTHYLKGEKEETLRVLDTLQSVAKPSFETERLRAKLFLEMGRDEDALRAYQRAIDIDPYYPYMHYTLGLLLQKSGRRAEAKDALRSAVRLEPGFADAVMELTSMNIADGELDEAEARLDAFLAVNPDHEDAVLMSARLYVERGKLDAAVRILEAFGRRSQLSAEGALLLGRAYYEAKDYEEAFRVFEALFANDAKSPEMAQALAEVSLKANKEARAMDYYREAIRLGPDDYRNYLALFFAASSRFAEKDTPTLVLPSNEMRSLVDRAGRHVPNDDFEAAYLVGISYQSIEQLDSARVFLEKAQMLKPGDERALLNLASVLEKMKRYDEAERYVALLHERKPKDGRICNFFGYLLALMNKDLSRAEQLIRTALQDEPENGYYIDSLGWVYYQRGEFGNAVIELERASSFVADDPIILEHLGDAYQSLQQFRKALAAYEKSRELQNDNEEIHDKIDRARRQLDN